MVQRGHLLTIEPDECRRLLGDATVGRVCWQSARGLEVLPVNYGLAEGALVQHGFSGAQQFPRAAGPSQQGAALRGQRGPGPVGAGEAVVGAE